MASLLFRWSRSYSTKTDSAQFGGDSARRSPTRRNADTFCPRQTPLPLCVLLRSLWLFLPTRLAYSPATAFSCPIEAGTSRRGLREEYAQFSTAHSQAGRLRGNGFVLARIERVGQPGQSACRLFEDFLPEVATGNYSINLFIYCSFM